jgi:NAD+ kinase
VNVALRGDGTDVAAALDRADASVVAEGAARVDAVVAVGEAGLRSVAADVPDAPVLAVAEGRYAVPRSTVDDALAALAAGEARIDAHPLLGVCRDGATVARAVRDVVLVTAAPASISEYAVGDDESVRADGVVVATPAGSDGYAAAAGGPVLDPDTGVVVVPIAPFSTSAAATVVDVGVGLPLSVEREGEIALFVDGVRHGSVDTDTEMRIERAGSVDLVSTGTENF